MIISHEHPMYTATGQNTWNGAFYYSQEICRNIIPRVKTDRNWITININGVGASHSVVFIHNNLHPELYDWLSKYDDLILVCGVPETCDKVRHLGKAIYLPLSVDVEYVKQFRLPKTRECAYVGRPNKRERARFKQRTDFIEGLPRYTLLARMSEYGQVYAVGRTAIEARILGCELLPYDKRFPDVDFWQVIDNAEAASILQSKLDEIDKE